MVFRPSRDDPSAVLHDQPPSRSFFSRFVLPTRSRSARSLVDFHIRPAEPHRKYKAGDIVTGSVYLAVVNSIRITHLTVALRGFVHVYKNPNSANEAHTTPGTSSDGVSHFRFLGNGYASLFQDEQVLCADGRLEAGRYEFKFELDFPREGLPSSIEFERGAISYMITATLTRPTAIAPTTSCERRIELVEQVDVGPLAPPRPRTIYLEPISRKVKKKKAATGTVLPDRNTISAADKGETASDLGSTRVKDPSTDGSNVADDSSQDAHHNPRSPVHSDLRSDVSGESAASGSIGMISRAAELIQPGSPNTTYANASVQAQFKKTIITTIELGKGGCLAGDTIPIKVNVQHTKPVRSIHGVIVTLYRQGRVDSAPPVSLLKTLSKEEMRKLEKEEYYPKSKTGLGGLSLTSAGSCSVFRKDLSQSIKPLIVDPQNFTATVTVAVRVPEDAFPSIRSVPGEMISFKYRLEVIVDLGGRLSYAIQIGQNPRVTAAGGALSTTKDVSAGVSSFDGSMINTDPLKREKGVIFDSFEVVVGTKDSRRRGKTAQTSPSKPTASYEGTIYSECGAWSETWEHAGYGAEDRYVEGYGSLPTEPATQPPYWYGGSADWGQPPAPHHVPPPQLPDERGLSEKERIRRAEQRLLPSQPDSSAAVPSLSYSVDIDSTGPSSRAPLSNEPTAPTAPTTEDLTASVPAPDGSTNDDKQEMERQRLLAEASAPPVFPEDFNAGVGNSSTIAGPSANPPTPMVGDSEPSAPALMEDEYGPQYSYSSPSSSIYIGAAPPEPLPAYHR